MCVCDHAMVEYVTVSDTVAWGVFLRDSNQILRALDIADWETFPCDWKVGLVRMKVLLLPQEIVSTLLTSEQIETAFSSFPLASPGVSFARGPCRAVPTNNESALDTQCPETVAYMAKGNPKHSRFFFADNVTYEAKNYGQPTLPTTDLDVVDETFTDKSPIMPVAPSNALIKKKKMAGAKRSLPPTPTASQTVYLQDNALVVGGVYRFKYTHDDSKFVLEFRLHQEVYDTIDWSNRTASVALPLGTPSPEPIPAWRHL
jgi:hypothetical protein